MTAAQLPLLGAAITPYLALVSIDAWMHEANHRMHHDAECAARGVNFGGVFVIWDRLFGTYSAPRTVRAFGIEGREAPRNWRELYTAPFR